MFPISWPWIEGSSTIFGIFRPCNWPSLARQEPAELVDVWTPGVMPAAPAKPRWTAARWQCSCSEGFGQCHGYHGWFMSSRELGCHSAVHPSRRVLQKSYAREQSGGGGTDVRRPIRPDGQETSTTRWSNMAGESPEMDGNGGFHGKIICKWRF